MPPPSAASSHSMPALLKLQSRDGGSGRPKSVQGELMRFQASAPGAAAGVDVGFQVLRSTDIGDLIDACVDVAGAVKVCIAVFELDLS